MSQHLQTSVTRLSQMPVAILARVLALRGAMTNASAHFRSYICKTGSPRLVHLVSSSASYRHSMWESTLSYSRSSFRMNFFDYFGTVIHSQSR
jgi:hypothetical protein